MQTENATSSASEKHTDFIKKASICLKITTTLFTFCAVLVAGGVSKGALFLMLGQARPFNNNTNSSRSLKYCPENVPGNERRENVTYEVQYGENEAIAWMW